MIICYDVEYLCARFRRVRSGLAFGVIFAVNTIALHVHILLLYVVILYMGYQLFAHIPEQIKVTLRQKLVMG